MPNTIPPQLLLELNGISGYEEDAFLASHAPDRQVVSIRLNPAKAAEVLPQYLGAPVPWAAGGRYLTQRPSFTLDPLLHAGAYYVQDASSMFIEQCFLQHCNLAQPLVVLDLCAAPGGKSTHLQSLLSAESVLVCNEVIKSRVGVLIENLTKWGAANVVVTNNDASHFARLPDAFDALLVDAPCSGSGLFRKDEAAIGEWSTDNVVLCSARQQRILADVWPCLKPGGLLVYSTCSYSAAENEAIADWLVEQLGAQPLSVSANQQWGIVETHSPQAHAPGYRFFPHLVMGEGFFCGAFRKPESEADAPEFQMPKRAYKPSKVQLAAAAPWLASVEAQLYQHQAHLFAMPPNTFAWFLAIDRHLQVRKAGIKLGTLAHGELLPDHALALSGWRNSSVPTFNLNLEEALRYLKRQPFELENQYKGWALMTYADLPIGFIKLLGNRFNNYYPADWRIRMA